MNDQTQVRFFLAILPHLFSRPNISNQIFQKRDFFEVNFPKSKLRLFSESEFSETKTFSKTKFPKQKPRPQKVGKSLETKKSQK